MIITLLICILIALAVIVKALADIDDTLERVFEKTSDVAGNTRWRGR